MSDLLPVISELSKAVNYYEQNRRKLSREQKLAVLGARFSMDIQAATNPEDLSNIMMEANKISFAVGVPELAGQVNNLGRVRLGAIEEGKRNRITSETNELLKNTVSEQMVLHNDQYVPLGQVEEFQQVSENYSPEMQAAAYKSLSEKHATQIMRQVYPEGEGELGLFEYGVNRKGEVKLTKQLVPGEGGYEDLLTAAEDNLPIPPEITAKRTEMFFDEDKMDRQIKKELQIYNEKIAIELRTPRTAYVEIDGREVERMIQFQPNEQGGYDPIDFMTKEKYDPAKVMRYHATGVYDPVKAAKDFNYFADQSIQEQANTATEIIGFAGGTKNTLFDGTALNDALKSQAYEKLDAEGTIERLLTDQEIREEIMTGLQQEREEANRKRIKPAGKWHTLKEQIKSYETARTKKFFYQKQRDALSGVKTPTNIPTEEEINDVGSVIDDIISPSTKF